MVLQEPGCILMLNLSAIEWLFVRPLWQAVAHAELTCCSSPVEPLWGMVDLLDCLVPALVVHAGEG